MTEKAAAHGVTLRWTKTLEATVIRACLGCGAPGIYSASEEDKNSWPGIYDPDRARQLVGDICPNCGVKRSANEDLGEIWNNDPR